MNNILFNVEMTKAILDGRKVQTRRVVSGGFLDENEAFAIIHLFKAKRYKEAKETFGFNAKYQIGETINILTTIPSLNGNYALDFFGNVYSKAYGDWRKLKPAPSNKGYLSVSISIDGKKKTKTIHKMMAETFYREVLDGEQVRHLNSNTQNNHINNIDIGSACDNMQDRSSEKNHNGEKHIKSKLTKNQVIRIRKSDRSQRQLAREYGVSQHCIMDIKNNNTWNDAVKPIKINIPRYEMARIFLKITDVRVKRLQDISVDDMVKEGLSINHKRETFYIRQKREWINLWNSTAKDDFKWENNPSIFVYEFKRVKVI